MGTKKNAARCSGQTTGTRKVAKNAAADATSLRRSTRSTRSTTRTQKAADEESAARMLLALGGAQGPSVTSPGSSGSDDEGVSGGDASRASPQASWKPALVNKGGPGAADEDDSEEVCPTASHKCL